MLRAAGIPAIVVHRFDDAARHPLVLSWPATRLGRHGRARVLAYVRHGGTFLAVAPNKAVRAAIGAGHSAFFTRLVQVPERGLESGGHLRDSQIAALRRFWAATPGGFRLGDAPGGARSALVLLHDVRGLPALRASKALVRREHRTGVHATYVFQTRYLADARGTALVGPALAQLVKAVRAASSDAIAGGVAGGPLAQTPRGNGGEAYPTYAAAFASSTEVDGETLSGELRVSRYVLDALGAGDVQAFRGVSGDTPRGFAAVAEASGHRRGRHALGGRRRRRVPVLAGAGGRPRAPAAALSGRLRRRAGGGPGGGTRGGLRGAPPQSRERARPRSSS